MKLVDLLSSMNPNEENDFKVDEHGVLRFRGRVCVPNNHDMKKMILEESHRSSMSIHPGANKVYQDLKKMFLWPGMKRHMAQFMYACLNDQMSKV